MARFFHAGKDPLLKAENFTIGMKDMNSPLMASIKKKKPTSYVRLKSLFCFRTYKNDSLYTRGAEQHTGIFYPAARWKSIN
ncbi:MAG: hypothetical protein WB792_04875 [Desulfobacterales bacterium]